MRSITPPRFKHRKLSFYIIFSFYLFLCAFILVESAIPGTQSGGQSNWVSQIIANVLNWFSGDTPAEIVEPTGVWLNWENGDSSLLGPGQIAMGTTTRLEFSIQEPSYSKGQTASREFTYEKLQGEDYDVLTSSYTDGYGVFHTIARIISHGEPEEDCVVRFYAGSKKSVYYDYHFDVVELPAPNEGEYTVTLDGYRGENSGYVLAQNESVLLDVTLASESHNDAYLRRYYDPRKLEAKSSNEAVVSIDQNGLILAKSEGSATISYGSYSFNITVSSASASIGNELSLTYEGSISENDYDVLGDYVDDNEVTTREAVNSIGCGVVLTASDGLANSDATYTWEVVDEQGNPDYLGGKIIPLDQKGHQARLLGYRRGPDEKVYVKCTLNKAVGETLVNIGDPFTVVEILPVSMDISGGTRNLTSGHENGSTIALASNTYFTSKQLTLTGTFLGENDNENVTNTVLVASDYDTTAFTVAGNGSTSLNLTFMKEGTYTIKISSEANPDLFYIFSFPIEQTPNVDGSSGAFQTFIRKFMGHGSLFALTGIFGMLFFAFWWGKDNLVVWPLICNSGAGFLLGCLSEFIQRFAPDRGPSWYDVGIDCLGYLIGTLIVVTIIVIVRLIKRNKGKNSPQEIEETSGQG